MTVNRSKLLSVNLRLMGGFESATMPKFRTILERQASSAARAYEQGGRSAAEKIIGDYRPDLIQTMIATQLEVGRAFGKLVLKMLTAKATNDPFEEALRAWITAHSLEAVASINDTTKAKLSKVILAGELESLGTRAVSKKIREEVGGAFSAMRAQTIARTEVHNAATFASDAAATSTGLDLEREWLSAEDSRTRESHSMADGQRRKNDEAFDVGGHKMMRPGDPSAPAEEIVNCRCVLAYHPIL